MHLAQLNGHHVSALKGIITVALRHVQGMNVCVLHFNRENILDLEKQSKIH